LVKQIGEILGEAFEVPIRRYAYVRCGGHKSKSTSRYDYFGLNNCKAAMQLAGGGPKNCTYGCLGAGSCLTLCKFDAITLHDGLAAIDLEKCTGCAACIKACPKKLIKMVPYKNKLHVACLSKAPGREVRKDCKVGCIGCKLCKKACTFDAIFMKDNYAYINYSKCTQCEVCMTKCPSKCIVNK
jgi:electron transport complex protein RnfB